MITTIRYILITALRDWLFTGLFAAIFISFGIAVFLGNTALVEEAQMTITYVAGSTRVITLIGLIIFVCFHVRGAFNNKEVELILSRPISRTQYVFAYWLGFSVVAVLLIVPLIMVMALFLKVHMVGLLYWGASILLEAFFVVAFALFSALILRSAVTSVLLCFGFYAMSRMMGFFLFIIEAPHMFNNFDFGYVTGKLLQLVSVLLPRLDLYGKSSWLIYGVLEDSSHLVFLPQTLIYVPLILSMAVFDFKRKQF